MSRALAYAIATLVHAATVICVAGGLALIILTWFQFLTFLAGLFLLFIGWALRPRRIPPPKIVTSRDRIPTWYRIVDVVASTVGSPSINEVIISAEFNASYQQRGVFRRKSTLRLGAPLLVALGPREQIALLAHEMAHGANQDPRRGFYLQAAFNALRTWWKVLHPGRLDDAPGVRSESAPFFATIANLLMASLAMVPTSIAFVLVHLVWRDSQRAEYLADRLSVQAAGTEPVLNLLDRLHYGRVVNATVSQMALGREKVDAFATIRESLEAIPAHELERIRRVERMAGSRLDATHPPTAYRIDMIRSSPDIAPAVAVSDADQVALESELYALEPAVRQVLIDSYRRRLYA